jgi:hypothetical protein
MKKASLPRLAILTTAVILFVLIVKDVNSQVVDFNRIPTVDPSLLSLAPMAQPHEEGQLYVCVYDPSGIPSFSGDTVIMKNDSLRILFTYYSVYSFDRAFPQLKASSQEETYLLDKVYILKCRGDAGSLLQEMKKFSGGIYYYAERVPHYEPIGGTGIPIPEYPVSASPPFTPNDPYFNQQWALTNIRAKEAWEYTHGHSTVLIGIPDFGFNVNHIDLQSKIEHTLFNTSDPIHGTPVAGCAAAATNNYEGVSAIGFNCKLILGYPDWNMILQMSNLGAKVINASFAGCHAYYTTVLNTIHLMGDQGTLMVAGAGNGTEAQDPCAPNGNGYYYPASYDPVISVTSVGEFDNHIFNQTHSHTHNDKVDVCAPGYKIWSTCGIGNQCYTDNNWGTSFASPIVAGLAALIYTVRSCLTPEEVKYIIETTADDIYGIAGNSNFTGLLGHGRINAEKAVKKAKNIQTGSDERITGQVTWTTEHYIKDYILVDPGSTLTIKADVLFNTGARVVVKPGGTVIIDGSTLRNNFCQGMWLGIRVQGLRNESQLTPGKHGKVILSNGATIRNALTGIDLIYQLEDTVGGGKQPGAGGIVQAENAFFINNRVAVNFEPYENFQPGIPTHIIDNVSYFKNVVFKTDDQLIDPSENPDAFVKLDGVRGIKFQGCSFINDIPVEANQYTFPSTRGSGIYSFNSSFSVDKPNATSTDQCKFIRLFRGIEAYGISTDKTLTINETKFDTVCKAIYLNAIDHATITGNHIKLFDSDVFLPDMAYGIYLNNCTGYKVEENVLMKELVEGQSSVKDHYGIVVKNSLDDNNFIYRNTLKEMSIGILAQGDNRGTQGGLVIKCNKFDECDFDIVVSPDGSSPPQECGIAYNQGSNNSQSAPAGNWFDKNVPPWDKSDYYFYTDCGSILYYHNNKSNSPPATWPSDYSNKPIITLIETSYSYDEATSCPSNIGLSPELLNLILMDAATGIVEMAPLGNPASNVNYQFSIISSAAYDMSKALFKRPDRAFFENDKDVLKLYSTITNNIKGLRSLPWKYRTVFGYLAVKDTSKAMETLNEINSQYRLLHGKATEYKDYTDYVSILKDLLVSGKSVHEVTDAQKDILSRIGRNRNSFVGAYARNILRLSDPRPEQETIFKP